MGSNGRPSPNNKGKNKMYDSELETRKHIENVGDKILQVIKILADRISMHDNSKLQAYEKKTFDKFTPRLADSTYGSDEYKGFLKEMKPALDHHYRNNSHHPEHYENGIKGMTLIDIIEMLCDWKSATMRHKDGDIFKSINMNQKRFGYSNELKEILKNTAIYLRY